MSKRTVLVTGGSSGIGKALVECFAADGYEVWFTYLRGADRAHALTASLSGKSQAFFYEQGNWQSHVELLQNLPGPVDVLINNAALGSATVCDYASLEHLQDQALMQVNAIGALWLTRQLLPDMLKNGFGKIIMISSVGGGITQFPGFKLADGMSKAALVHLTKQLAAELHHEPVDVFAICPGATDTPMFGASTLDHLSNQQRRTFESNLPKGRLIAPAEVAELALYLCREGSQLLHGAVVDASMGLGVNPGLITHLKNEHANEPPQEPVTRTTSVRPPFSSAVAI
jgi:NAD(P)-dependent dehydrogenase (short-subunit alcohol dehydrogenase family)